MSLLFAAAIVVSQAQAIQSPPSQHEEAIIVVGQRMRRLKLHTRTDRKTGVSRCVFKRRSGDEAFDTIMCDAVLACGKTVRTTSEMESCVAPSIEAYVRQLAARRNS